MAVANFSSPNPRVWLENENFTQTTHANNTGQIGDFARSVSNGYTDETLLKFDVSSLAGATVTAVSLDITCNTKGGSSTGATATVWEQDKTNPTGWSSPPEFDDFAQTVWTNSLSTQTVANTGSYNFATSAAFVAYVQSWIDDSADNWGVVVAVNFGAIGWYLSLDAATLNVTYTIPSEDNTKIAYTRAGSSVFNVPAGVSSVTIKSWGGGAGGAGGGTSGVGGSGGGGGYVQGTIAVTPGEALNIHVGGKGGLGTFPATLSGSGGGGAGRSSVSRDNTPLFIAGAGGGGGGGDNSTATADGAGGAGGAGTGGSGGNSSSSIGAGGGTQVDGGAGGIGGANVGVKGEPPAALTLGNCLKFDASPESVNLGTSSVFNFTTNFTLECWINPSVVVGTQNTRAIGSRSNDTLHGVGFGYNGSSRFLFTTFGHQDFLFDATVSTNTWTHIAVSFSSGFSARLYVNGVFQQQITGSTAATTSGINMYIGQGGSGIEYFTGKIDEVRMWNDIRTDAEIKKFYSEEVDSGSANLVGYWKLDEGSGSTTADETTNNNDGTLLNMEADDWIVPSDWVPPVTAGAGGDGADGTDGAPATKGGEANGGITNGGDGGLGDAEPAAIGFGGGGGGGSGYGGGGGGAGSVAANAGGGGGGGGSNYIDSGATTTTNSQASGVTPPNTGDGDYQANAGVGGAGGATSTAGSNGNDGRVVILWSGATFYYGLQFTAAVNEYLSSVSAFTPPANGSVAFWIYMYDNPGTDIIKLLGYDGLWEIGFNTLVPGSIRHQLNQGVTPFDSNTIFQAYRSYHVVCTYTSGGNARIIVDGVLDKTATGQTGSPAASGTLYLGNTTGTPSAQNFNGLLEDIRIYDRVLSDAECATIHACKGTDGISFGLLNRWLLNEGPMETGGSGTGIIKDIAINKLNMTPNMTPRFKGSQLKIRRFG